jgi:RNA polymerase sigma factor (sigma-70 family)
MLDRDAHILSWNKFIKGDEHALLEMYRQHYLGLMNYGGRFIDQGDFVNDCIIDMLLRLWEKRSSLPQVENVRSYLLTTLRRTILDRFEAEKRRERKNLEIYKSSEEHQWSYEEYVISIQSDEKLKARITHAMKRLTARQLELIRLRFFEDLDYDEIAERCSITKRTAYNIVHDAITILKQELSNGENTSFSINLSIASLAMLAIPAWENIF